MSWSSQRLKVFPDCPPICYGGHYKCSMCNFAFCDDEDIPSWRALNGEQVRRKVEAIHQELNSREHQLKVVKRSRWS